MDRGLDVNPAKAGAGWGLNLRLLSLSALRAECAPASDSLEPSRVNASPVSGQQSALGSAPNGATFVDAQSKAASLPKPFDIDGDGMVSPTTDGLMLLRVALGITGDAVVTNATAPGAPRNTWALVRPYLMQQCGLVLAP